MTAYSAAKYRTIVAEAALRGLSYAGLPIVCIRCMGTGTTQAAYSNPVQCLRCHGAGVE